MIVVAHKRDAKIPNPSKIDKELFLSLIHSVWNVKPETRKKKNNHPAPFSIEIPKRLITLLSGEGATVLDSFVGSGTTMIAAERLKRNSIGIETSKDYCELSYQRLKNEIEQEQTKLTKEQSTIEKIGF